jgi:hypothetical protein
MYNEQGQPVQVPATSTPAAPFQGVPAAFPGQPAQQQYGAPQYPGQPQVQPGYSGQPPYTVAPQGFAPGQGFAPPPPDQFGGDLGAAIAGASLGITRYPAPDAGDYVWKIKLSKKPGRAVALVAELEVLRTTSTKFKPGDINSFYQGLGSGDPDTQSAQQGGALAFILRASGYATPQALQASGMDPAQWAAHIRACIGAGPGPLVDRIVGCRVSNSGKFTKPKIGPGNQVVGGGEPIINWDWYIPAA